MDLFGVLSLVGGLALFLYGMNVMGAGLEKVSGGKLEKILGKLTSNPLKAVLLGAGVTAVIQSSSATTVMVVGFVNSGIMKLNQVIGIIMGANLGTTVTSWILSLTGVESDNILIKLFKPSSFSPVLALIGIILLTASKNGRKKDIGTIMLGFAVLMFGMDAMSNAVEPLKNVPEFQNILTIFTNPVFGVLAGAALTAIIQSSSASVGILQALSQTGRVSFSMAVPIIMGQNIGTCVTALLSSISANKNAKRAAFVHLYFNVIGTVLFLTLYTLAINLFDLNFLTTQTVDGFSIAVIHTLFNILATAVLLPFTKLLEKLAYLTIKDKDGKEEFQTLDERFLQSPAFAIEQCRNKSVEMAHVAKDALLSSLDMLEKYSEKKAEDIIEKESIVDSYEDRIGSYLVKISAQDMATVDSNTISKLLHTIGDFERISDHAVNILEVAKEIHDKKLEFSYEAQSELNVMIDAVREILVSAVSSFDNNDLSIAENIEPLEEVIDHLRAELKNRHINRLCEGKCTIEMGFVLSDLLTNLERVADHCSNIAVCVIQIKSDGFDPHEYLNDVKNTNETFAKEYSMYKLKYSLNKN